MSPQIEPKDMDLQNLASDFVKALEEGAEAVEGFNKAFEGALKSVQEGVVLELETKLAKWALRFNRWPWFLRPVCLHYFRKWAKRLDDAVFVLYPPAPGAALPSSVIWEPA